MRSLRWLLLGRLATPFLAALALVGTTGDARGAHPVADHGGAHASPGRPADDPLTEDALLPARLAAPVGEVVPAPAAEAAADDGVLVTYRITAGNAVGLTLYNNGLVGNNFNSRRPSFEYPLGSNIDHMPRGGIWIGGISVDGDTLVSTATIDGYIGDVDITSELLPLPQTGIEERSILPNSRAYHPLARSEQDFLFSCADTAATLITSGQDPHRPLSIQVDGTSYLFGFEPFEATVITIYRIINLSRTDPIYNLRVGMYGELATGYKDPAVVNWTSGWFRRKALGWVDSLRLCTEHHHALGDGRAPSWAGLMLLGSKPDPIDSLTVSFNWWNWDPGAEVDDRWRYRQLGNGEIDPVDGIVPGTDDPVEVLSVGDFSLLEAGDTLTVGFAWVGGQDDREISGRDQLADIIYNARWAQIAYDLEFRIPMPPPSPDVILEPGRGSLTLVWSGEAPERFKDPKTQERDFEGYRIYISEERSESGFRRILERDRVDGIAFDTGLDDLRHRLLSPAETLYTGDGAILDILPEVWEYRYTVHGLRDGFKYWVAVTSFDQGTIDIQPLESGLAQNLAFTIPGSPAVTGGAPAVQVFPNPYRGDAAWDGSLRRDRYLWFTNLPPRCTIRIYTLAGDLVDTIRFDQATYAPTDVRGIYDPTDPRNPERDLPVLSGGMAAWDLVSREDQGVASGLYLFSVEDHDSGDRQTGKFLVIK